ncbi:MAG: asparagine synthase (glutamine-hydrolyzing) [Acidimicrobiales bacterium]
MCGFTAALLRRPDLTEAKLREALASIVHRGPDATTTWMAPDGSAALGHVRLSIIGLDNGTQPIADRTEQVRVVVNGEFYGYQRQRDELRSQGHEFSTDSDSEVALHLYLRYGTDFVHRLRGEYAVVLHDQRTQSMVAVRDRFGIKPLFYTVRDGSVYFASEIKALLALGIPSRWNPTAYAQEMFMLRPQRDTLFAGIHTVPPGHYALASDGEVTLHEYWDTDYPKSTDLAADTRSESEMVDGFREVLSDAMKERLVADVEVASYLSGGIDSCAVLGLAQEHTDRPIRAFTITFDDAQFDESALAQQQAKLSGATYHPVPVSQQNLADVYSDAVWHAETVFVNGHGVAKYLLSEAVRDAGIKVVFTGEGADELLAGYPPFRQDLLKHNTEGQDPAEIETMMKELAASQAMAVLIAPDETPPELNELERRLGFVPSWITALSSPGLVCHGLFRDEFTNGLAGTDPLTAALADIPFDKRLAGRDPVNQALYLWTRTMLPNFVLTFLSDRMEMSHSIEGRVPFLDHHVAEYAAGLPVAMKVKGMREKHVLREAVKDVVIEPVYNREKHPFATPPATSSDDPMLTYARDILTGSSFDDQPIFDPVKCRTFLDDLENRDQATRSQADTVVQRLLSTTLLHQRFNMS